MTHTRLILIALALFPIALAAQTSGPDPSAASMDAGRTTSHGLQNTETRIVYLTNTSQLNDANEILVAVRNMFDPSLKVYFVASQNAIVLSAPPDQLNNIEAFIHTLDKPHRTFKLTYTIAESDGGKNVGIQHFSIVANDGQRTTMKQGDKIPVATGSFSTENSAAQTQFTYLDVGMNFDATVSSYAGGVLLKTKVEQSSVGPSTTIAGVAEPVVRQTVLEGVSATPLGKPLKLGSIDVPDSTRHIDIDVMIEAIK